jgi:hypothetical protein
VCILLFKVINFKTPNGFLEKGKKTIAEIDHKNQSKEE